RSTGVRLEASAAVARTLDEGACMAVRAVRWILIVFLIALAMPAARAAAGTDLSWDAAPSLGVARADLAVMTDPVDTRIYALGGNVSGNPLEPIATVERLTPSAGAWERLPELGVARDG